MLRKEIALIGLGALVLLAGCAPGTEETSANGTTAPPASSNAQPVAANPTGGTPPKTEIPAVTAGETPKTEIPAVTVGTPTDTKPADSAKDSSKKDSNKEVTTTSGLKYVDVKVGTGETPKVGQIVSVHYTGTFTNGAEFDTSRDDNKPLEFPIGMRKVVAGWDEGIMTMKVGGKRKLIVPPSLGYGDSDYGPIPGGSTLLFDVELLGIK